METHRAEPIHRAFLAHHYHVNQIISRYSHLWLHLMQISLMTKRFREQNTEMLLALVNGEVLVGGGGANCRAICNVFLRRFLG